MMSYCVGWTVLHVGWMVCYDVILCCVCVCVCYDVILCSVSGESVSKCKECLLARVELHCDKCRLSLCSKCFKIVHASANVLRAHTPTPITQANSTPCPLHPGELQRHYCIETAQLMCVLCSLEEEHRGHTIVSLAQAVSTGLEVRSMLVGVVCVGRGYAGRAKATPSSG